MALTGHAVALALVLGCAGCARPPFIEADRSGGVTARSDRIGWYTKKVVAKQPPTSLIAEDGTICRVVAERFRDIAIGATQYCNWH